MSHPSVTGIAGFSEVTSYVHGASDVPLIGAVDDALDRRLSTVGRIQPHVEVKIVDTAGRVVPRA